MQLQAASISEWVTCKSVTRVTVTVTHGHIKGAICCHVEHPPHIKSMGKRRTKASAANEPIDIPVPSVEALQSLPTIPSRELVGKDRHTLVPGECVYVLPPGVPWSSDRVYDGHKLQIKAVISLHHGLDRDWALCRDLLHASDPSITQAIAGEKRDYFGKAEVVATFQQSAVDLGRVISPVEVAIFDVTAVDVPEIPADGWWLRYLLNGATLSGFQGTLTNPQAAAIGPAGTACCDKPYNPNDVKGQSVYCPDCSAWYHISCRYGDDPGDPDTDDEEDGRWVKQKGARGLIENIKNSPIIRGAFYKDESFREDWMLGGSGFYIRRFNRRHDNGQLGQRPTVAKVKKLFGNDTLLADLQELNIPDLTCPSCQRSL
ncbi:hypothetical protein NMY22_g9583 [Coprinellus aureogranulatus]|nr:hypothetical protein NMY22_g9583 [Coprinellus aureogranulatus]